MDWRVGAPSRGTTGSSTVGLVRPEISGVSNRARHEGDVVKYEYEKATPASGLRLHLNENTGGCSPAVVRALQAMTRHDVAVYPEYDEAIAACAARLHVTPDWLLLTNGLDEGILAAAVVAHRGADAAAPSEAVVIVPAFDMYAACSDAAGGRVIEVPLGPGFAFPLEAVVGAIGERTRIVWLTNPNNPTGQMIPREAIVRIAERAPQALVFVDEAYGDFSGETLIGDPLLSRRPNVVVGRTFAKAYGLAGMRVGAVIAQPDTIARLRRVVPPYSINACAAAVLPAACADADYYDRYLREVAQSKALLYDVFERRGIVYWKSAANFVLARFDGESGRIAAALAARGIHVRDRSRDAGCADCLRITAGVLDHTREFVAALGDVL
jgi:histidinol-phosphate aminotransferase